MSAFFGLSQPAGIKIASRSTIAAGDVNEYP